MPTQGQGSLVNGSRVWNSKTFLFANPNTLLLKHMFNGFGNQAEQQERKIFDLTGADIVKGGEVHLCRADNDVYPRNGGMSDASFQIRATSLSMAAFNTFTKGDELEDISILYEGRAEARDKVLAVALSGGIVVDDLQTTGQHGAQPGTASLTIEATIPVDVGGSGLGGSNGPYHAPWTMNVLDDNTRDDGWTPPTVAIP